MEKILTISIAAYNVEKFIEQALDSCIVSEVMNDMEVIIVDDGSKDRTAEIAQKYVDMYPDTFILISKKNGGYGSTVNSSLKIARGKYFKQLDGDDWFDSLGLIELVKAAKKTDNDVILTPYVYYYEKTNDKKLCSCECSQLGYDFTFDTLDKTVWIKMYSATIKTSIYKEHDISITENCFYTDNEIIAFAMPWVKTLAVLKEPVYCYRIGREGQSTSISGIIKHFDEHLTVFDHLLDVYKKIVDSENDALSFYKRFMRIRYLEQIEYFLLLPPKKSAKKRLCKFENNMKINFPEIYKDAEKGSNSLKLLRASRYILYRVLRLRAFNRD